MYCRRSVHLSTTLTHHHRTLSSLCLQDQLKQKMGRKSCLQFSKNLSSPFLIPLLVNCYLDAAMWDQLMVLVTARAAADTIRVNPTSDITTLKYPISRIKKKKIMCNFRYVIIANVEIWTRKKGNHLGKLCSGMMSSPACG